MLSLTQRNHLFKWPLRWKLNFTYSFLTRETDLNRILFWEVNITHWNKHARKISLWRSLRSKIWWLAEFCNSHCVSHFAAFFIVMGTKISIVENFLFIWWLGYFLRVNKFKFVRKPHCRTKIRFKICVNDPSAGSPTETLLRLFLPLSDMVYLTSRISWY